MKYYLAIKGNEIMIHATTLMDLENIVLGERCQSQKTTYYMIKFIWKSTIETSTETESRPVIE